MINLNLHSQYEVWLVEKRYAVHPKCIGSEKNFNHRRFMLGHGNAVFWLVNDSAVVHWVFQEDMCKNQPHFIPKIFPQYKIIVKTSFISHWVSYHYVLSGHNNYYSAFQIYRGEFCLPNCFHFYQESHSKSNQYRWLLPLTRVSMLLYTIKWKFDWYLPKSYRFYM